MKRLVSIFAALSLAVVGLSASANDGFTYIGLGAPALAPGGLTVTLNSLQIVEKSGSTQLVINYSQKNNTADKKLDEGSFKLFFTDGTSEPQYGAFNSFFPGDGNTRSYTWEWLKGKEPWLIEWEAGFFTAKPTATGLKWKVGSNFPAPSPAPSKTAKPAPKPIKYKNCAALQKVYAGGVALSSKSVNKGGKIKLKPTVNAKVYNLNKSLDRDKDGLACER